MSAHDVPDLAYGDAPDSFDSPDGRTYSEPASAATPGQAERSALGELLHQAAGEIRRCRSAAVVCQLCEAQINAVLDAADTYAIALADRLGAAIRAAAQGERERIRDLAVLSGAECREGDGTPHPFAGLIGEDPGMFRGRPGDGEGGGG